MFTLRRAFPLTFSENNTTEAKITRGLLEMGIMLDLFYSITVTTAMTAVRARSAPVKRISIIGDGGRTLKVIKLSDIVLQAQLMEQTPLSALLVPPSAATAAAYVCEAHLPIFFQEPGVGNNGNITNLPTYAYDELTLRVEWGSVAELFVVGAGVANPIAVAAGKCSFTQIDAGGVAFPSNQASRAYASTLGVSVERYKEVQPQGVAATEFVLNVPTNADIRSILITSEDSTGEGTNLIVNKVSLRENNTTNVYSVVPWQGLRAENARVLGAQLPAGVALIDFAEDKDVKAIYAASKKDNVDLVFDINNVAGNIRAHFRTIEKPLPYRA